jgi:AraC-like DNA-binding protein
MSLEGRILIIEPNQLVEYMAAALFRIKGVYHYVISPGTKAIQKTAPYPGFVFPLSGSAEFQFNDIPYPLSPGSIIHGSAETVLKKRVIGNHEWEFISVIYEVVDGPPAMELAKQHFDLRISQSPRLHNLLRQLALVSKRSDAISTFRKETLFRNILENVFSNSLYKKHDARELFEFVVDYIHTHYMDIESVGELAQICGINENRLFYVFKKYSSLGPGDYLHIYRLEKARELILSRQWSIGTIAEQVGYYDPLHFSRIFKKYFGVAPSHLRQK